MVDKLKEELTNKEALLMQSKRGMVRARPKFVERSKKWLFILVKLQLERDLTNLKKAIEDHKKTETESKAHAVQQEKQLQKLQLLLQPVNGELRDATQNIQAVSSELFY